jgi:hypothetical protein
MCLKAVAFPIGLNNLVLTEPEVVGMFNSDLLKLGGVVKKCIANDMIQGAALVVIGYGKPVHFGAYLVSDVSKASLTRKGNMF